MNAALSPASALDSKGASASATTCSQAIIAPPALHQGLLRNAQEFLSGGEISHCLMWGGGQRRGGSNGVTRNGEDLRKEKSPGNIKLRHMVMDLADPDWRMTGTCTLCKSFGPIALTSISVHHGHGTSSNLPNPFGFSISSEQHERFTRCYCLLLAPRQSPFKVRAS